MSIFTEIERPTHLKGGIFGFAGGGKTTTAALIAIGLHKHIKSDKPVLFIDTETGSSYVKELFDKANVPILGKKTRAFVTLMAGMEEAVKGGHILLIDSVTHFWQELMTSYMKRKGITRLSLNHIGDIKKEWSPFPTLYLNSPIHSIICGRAGYEWGYEEDDEGAKKLAKTGTKMKVEGDFGYEPTLLIEMEQVREDKNKVGSGFINRAWVIKDKFASSKLQGHYFDMPTFDTFMPHIKQLNIGGVHPNIDVETSSEEMISSPDRSVSERLKRRDIFVEELKNELSMRWSSRKDAEKKEALEFLQKNFGTTSMTSIESRDAEEIQMVLEELRKLPIKDEKKGSKNDKGND